MKTVYDLTRDELNELKQQYLLQLADEGTYGEVMWGDKSVKEPSMYELSEANELVPDDVIFINYNGITFTEDDFFCNQKEVE